MPDVPDEEVGAAAEQLPDDRSLAGDARALERGGAERVRRVDREAGGEAPTAARVTRP